MVTRPQNDFRQCGMLQVDMLVAMSLLVLAVIPVAYSFNLDRKAMTRGYERAIAMELTDGEMEILLAGAWHYYPTGTNLIHFSGRAATNLSTSQATLLVTPEKLRLDWRPLERRSKGISREVKLP
jgi:hypothetical protein